MKAKRLISFVLAAAFMLSAAATPVFAAAALPQQTAAVEQENGIVSIRIKATGNLVYGSDYKLEVQTTPADTQYIGVVVGIGGEANGYVTLMLSDKIRTLLKMIPLPRKMSATPDQEEEFNLYAYLKQLIDGNDVSVLLRVADEVVSVMDVLQFYMPTIKDFSTGLKLALELIRKYLPEGAFSRIYVDEQPTDSGRYIAGAVALESGDMNTAGMAMFRLKPKSEGVRALLGAGASRQYDRGRGAELQPRRRGGVGRTGGAGGQGDLHLQEARPFQPHLRYPPRRTRRVRPDRRRGRQLLLR